MLGKGCWMFTSAAPITTTSCHPAISCRCHCRAAQKACQDNCSNLGCRKSDQLRARPGRRILPLSLHKAASMWPTPGHSESCGERVLGPNANETYLELHKKNDRACAPSVRQFDQNRSGKSGSATLPRLKTSLKGRKNAGSIPVAGRCSHGFDNFCRRSRDLCPCYPQLAPENLMPQSAKQQPRSAVQLPSSPTCLGTPR